MTSASLVRRAPTSGRSSPPTREWPRTGTAGRGRNRTPLLPPTTSWLRTPRSSRRGRSGSQARPTARGPKTGRPMTAGSTRPRQAAISVWLRTQTHRCRSTAATAVSRSSPPWASAATQPRSPPGRVVSTRPSPPTPNCSRSRSTKAAAALPHHPVPRLRDQPHPHPPGASQALGRTAAPVPATDTTSETGAPSFSSPTYAQMTRVLVPRSRHLPRPRRREAPWPSRGNSTFPYRVTSTLPSPPRSRRDHSSTEATRIRSASSASPDLPDRLVLFIGPRHDDLSPDHALLPESQVSRRYGAPEEALTGRRSNR